jgi:hypothetical protein
MGRLMLPIIIGLVALMVVSWALGEFLRQRKDK